MDGRPWLARSAQGPRPAHGRNAGRKDRKSGQLRTVAATNGASPQDDARDYAVIVNLTRRRPCSSK